MSSLTSYNKAQLIDLIEGYRTQVDDLTAANELLSAGVDSAESPAAAAPDRLPADMCMTGMLRVVQPVTRKDGTPVDGLFKFAVETSVSYTDGKDADGQYIWHRVNGYKTAWFTCDEQMASQLSQLLESNEWTLIRNWYRYATSARNVRTVEVRDRKTGQVVLNKQGQPVTKLALEHKADLKSLQVDVITSAPKGESDSDDDDDLL